VPGFRAGGRDLEDLYDPDTVGNGYVAAGLKVGGNAGMHFASAAYGTPGPYSGFNAAGVGDVGKQWAAKGTAVYSLPVNGKSYSSNNQNRGHAEVRLVILANGTYQVLDWRSDTQSSVLASGTWLTDGSPASQWSCNFDYAASNVSTIGSGSTGANSNAPNNGTLYDLGTDRYAGVFAQATLTTSRATCNGTIVLHLYKNGVKRSDTTIYSYNNVNGN
jgi:hypothetical protein